MPACHRRPPCRRLPRPSRRLLAGLTAGLGLLAGVAGCGDRESPGADAGSAGSVVAPATPGATAPTASGSPPPGTATALPPATSGPPTAGSGSPPPGAGRVHRLGPPDSGRAVDLRAGDRLEISLPTNRLANRWRLVDYPRQALRTDLRAATLGRFVFVAIAPGSGRITLSQAPCGGVGRPCRGAPPVDPPAPGRNYLVPVRVR